MPYNGPSVICRFCGLSFTRPASLVRHFDEGRCAREKPGAIVPARESKRVEAIENVPVTSQPRFVPDSAGAWPKLLEMPNEFSPDDGGGLIVEREGAICLPDANDGATLWSQYHALKALAVRLDAGYGTERDRVLFEAALREYNADYDRVRPQGSRAIE